MRCKSDSHQPSAVSDLLFKAFELLKMIPSMIWEMQEQEKKVKLRKGCVILKGLTLMLVWTKY